MNENKEFEHELDPDLLAEIEEWEKADYDGVETLDRKMERIMGEKFTEKMEDSE